MEKFKAIFRKDFWSSKNFITGAVSFILLVAKGFGLDISEIAVDSVVEALYPFDITAFVIALINLGNIIYHLIKPGGNKSDLKIEVERLKLELGKVKIKPYGA